MKLPGHLGYLTYCLNIHPTQHWAECRRALTGPAAAVKRAVSPDARFAVGLRFSADAAAGLSEPDAHAELKAIIAKHSYPPITANGFPYGPFHGACVKEKVYQPD